jgi:hypothetical protein
MQQQVFWEGCQKKECCVGRCGCSSCRTSKERAAVCALDRMALRAFHWKPAADRPVHFSCCGTYVHRVADQHCSMCTHVAWSIAWRLIADLDCCLTLSSEARLTAAAHTGVEAIAAARVSQTCTRAEAGSVGALWRFLGAKACVLAQCMCPSVHTHLRFHA